MPVILLNKSKLKLERRLMMVSFSPSLDIKFMHLCFDKVLETDVLLEHIAATEFKKATQ